MTAYESRQYLAGKGSAGLSNVFFVLTMVFFFLSLALVRFMVMGVPVRSIFGLGIFCLLYLLAPNLLIHAFRDMRRVILIIIYAACLGLIVSLFNEVSIRPILRQIVEIHFQAIIGVLTGYALLKIMGAKKLVKSFTYVVGLSCILAIFQAAGVDFSWRIREVLQQYQSYSAETFYLDNRIRAMGISFSPVHLGTQLCLAFAVSYILRTASYNQKRNHTLQIKTWLSAFVAILIAIISGNRSPIVGFLVFIVSYGFYLRPKAAFIASMFFIPILAIIFFNLDSIFEYLSNTGIRAFRVGDKSSEGREVLRAYGGLLFLNQPLGYGLVFKSTEHVNEFWSQLSHFDNANAARVHAVHNYYLNIILKYGFLILPVAIYSIRVLVKNISILLAFLPYAVHIFFHNDGPLQGDFLIWYFIPLIVVILHNKEIFSVINKSGSADDQNTIFHENRYATPQ